MEGKVRCIIAEDYKQLNDIYYNLLNYEDDIEVVGIAFNGSQALKLVMEKEIDVVLLDIEMDKKYDGIETCKKINEIKPNVKVIMLTCHYEHDTVLSAYKAGAVDYVLKTESSSVILDSVRGAYRNNSPIRPFIANIIRNEIKFSDTARGNMAQVVHIITQLTNSELEVLSLLSKNLRQGEIAQIRCTELTTVKSQINSILKKFNMKRTMDVINLLKVIGLMDVIN